MQKIIALAVVAFGLNSFAANSSWIKQGPLLVPVEAIDQVDTVHSKDGEVTVKIVSLKRSDDTYDIAVSFGGVTESQSFISTGYASVAGDYTLTKNRDKTYQLKMLLGTIEGRDIDGAPLFGSKNISLKISLDSEGRVSELAE